VFTFDLCTEVNFRFAYLCSYHHPTLGLYVVFVYLGQIINRAFAFDLCTEVFVYLDDTRVFNATVSGSDGYEDHITAFASQRLPLRDELHQGLGRENWDHAIVEPIIGSHGTCTVYSSQGTLRGCCVTMEPPSRGATMCLSPRKSVMAHESRSIATSRLPQDDEVREWETYR